jgi:hypothetical protein
MVSEKNYKWNNWAGNYSCIAANYYEPENEAELCEIISHANKTGNQVRVVGAGHSFSPIALSDHILISLKKQRNIISIEGNIVTCQPGIHLHELYSKLQASGLSLPNFGVINKQTLSGALSTGTHGSGLKHKSLSGCIKKLRLVLANGEVKVIDPETDLQAGTKNYNLLDSVSVSLGLLGIISQVTLECEPVFYLRSVEHLVSFDEYIESMDDLASQYEYFKAWWFPHTGKVNLFKAERIEIEVYKNKKALEKYSEEQKKRDKEIDSVTSPMFSRSNDDPSMIPKINQYCLEYYFTRRTRIGTGIEILVHDETVPMIVSEYALPLKNNQHKKALTDFKNKIESSDLKLHFPVDLRYTAEESSWLSPSFKNDSFYIGVCVREYSKKEIPESMKLFFECMKVHKARPNWGKLFELSGKDLENLFPRWGNFKEVKRKLDPGNMFTNIYLDKLLRD